MSRPTYSDNDLRIMQERIAEKNRAQLKVSSRVVKEVQPKKNKYGNRKTVVDGILFDSQKEANRYGILKLRQGNGEIQNLKLQVEFPIIINDIKVCKYVADFTYNKPVFDGDDRLIVEDCKGMKTAIYRLKKKLMKAVLGIDILET